MRANAVTSLCLSIALLFAPASGVLAEQTSQHTLISPIVLEVKDLKSKERDKTRKAWLRQLIDYY